MSSTAGYSFVTMWQFEAPIDRVWQELHDVERWPEWWKAVEAVEQLAPGDAAGVGAIHRYTWRGALPYRLSFEMTARRVEPHTCLEGTATGELIGSGRWTLSEGSATHVRYDWNVDTAKPWMRFLRPVARPLFAWNHDVVMRWGFEGLTKRLTK